MIDLKTVISYIIDNYVEILGAVFGFVYLYFSIKQKVWLWPVGIITSVFYIYVFFVSKFYADMCLQFYYVAVSIYGWYFWVFGKKKQETELQTTKTDLREIIILTVATIVLFIIISAILYNFTDSPVPIWDGFTTAASIIATWMLAKKKLENWLVWIVVDFLSISLFLYKELYVTSILFVAYTVLAFVGYFKWKKDFNAKINQVETN